jgi:hypothetical protein
MCACAVTNKFPKLHEAEKDSQPNPGAVRKGYARLNNVPFGRQRYLDERSCRKWPESVRFGFFSRNDEFVTL